MMKPPMHSPAPIGSAVIVSEEGKNLQPKQSGKPAMEDGMGKPTIENGR